MKYGTQWFFLYACVILTTASLAAAQTTAFTFDDPSTGAESTSGTDGLKFQTSFDVLVTDLGYYDRDQDGLELRHTVGIYEFGTQQLLVSAEVDSASSLDGLFRYTSIPPFALNAGTSYMLAGHHPGTIADPAAEILGASNVESADGIELEEYFFSESAELVFPLTSFEPFRFFGPNLRFTLGGDITEFDFDNDGQANCTDINALATAVANNTPDARFDLNNDFQLDLFDVEDWLLRAGVAATGAAYQNGDSNLDGAVDGADLAAWESNRFTAGEWCGGDFNADSVVDGSDFNIWNNAYQASAAASPVPEPHGLTIVFAALALLGRFRGAPTGAECAWGLPLDCSSRTG